MQLEQNEPNSVDLTTAGVHTSAGLLKCWLRELPSPLLPFALYRPLLSAHDAFTSELEAASDVVAVSIMSLCFFFLVDFCVAQCCCRMKMMIMIRL
jgi:hypothetical protein